MNLASIMVSVDLGAAAADRVQLATSLAKRFESRLIGVASRQVYPPSGSRDILSAVQVSDVAMARANRDLEQASLLFERSTEGFGRASWRSDLAHPTRYLMQQARAADVVVVGRWGAEDPDPGPLVVLPGPFVVEAGRPVLVAPPGIEELRIGRVVIAWKDGLEARRAVLHSLPFLERADTVHVVSVSPKLDDGGSQDVAEYLARHGAAVTTHLLRGDDLIAAAAILGFVDREGADLLVMDAYGHSRLQEWVFGDVTWDILRNTPVCCLMSN
ncbi:universal stress protein [Methylobacterium sp. CM6247]